MAALTNKQLRIRAITLLADQRTPCDELFLEAVSTIATTDSTRELQDLIDNLDLTTEVEEAIRDLHDDMYDPSDRGDAWSGGFARNH